MLKEGGTQTERGDTLFSVWHKFKKQGQEHQEYNYTSKNEQSWVPNGGYLAWCKDQPLCENGFKYVLWPTAFLEHPIYFQDCELTFGKRLALSLLCISCINCKIKQTRIKNWPTKHCFLSTNLKLFKTTVKHFYPPINLLTLAEICLSPHLTFTFATLDYPLHPPIPLSNLPLSLDPPLRLVHAWSSQTFKSSVPYSSLLCAIISSLFWLYLITAIPSSISHIPSPSLFSSLHSPYQFYHGFSTFHF